MNNQMNDEKAINAKMFKEVNKKSDKLIDLFLIGYFVFGLSLAFWYDTWILAIAVGGLSVGLYFLSKKMFPENNLHHYVASAVTAIFMAQFIYQMHGLFEMHFFAFIGAALMITYQNWRVLIPVAIIIAVHHGLFAYLEYMGNEDVFFTTEAYDMDLKAFVFHIVLAVIILFICGLWSYNLETTTKKNTKNMVLIENLNDTMMKNMEYLSMLAENQTDFDVEVSDDDMMGELIAKIKENSRKG